MWNADATRPDRDRIPPEGGQRAAIALIDRRVLDRECLARGLKAGRHDLEIFTFGSVAEWSRATDLHVHVAAILLSIGSQQADESQIAMALEDLTQTFPDIPTVVLSDSESAAHVLKALDRGARGFIPTSVGLSIAIEVVNLARAGGLFVPASCLMAARDDILAPEQTEPPFDPIADLLTPRQTAVAEAIRRGKANKIIAYELDLRESTIKVHIRSIMRKLGAHNRTEVAFKLNGLLQAAAASPSARDRPPPLTPPPEQQATATRTRSALPAIVYA